MPQATFALVNSAQVAVFEAKRRAGSRARAPTALSLFGRSRDHLWGHN